MIETIDLLDEEDDTMSGDKESNSSKEGMKGDEEGKDTDEEGLSEETERMFVHLCVYTERYIHTHTCMCTHVCVQ